MAETWGVKIGSKTITQPLTEMFAFDSSNRLEYHGQAAPGSAATAAVWRIFKYAYTGSNFNADSKKWAGGSADFNKIWNSKSGYTYS